MIHCAIDAMGRASCAEVISWSDSPTTHFWWTGNTWAYPVSVPQFEAHTATIRADHERSAYLIIDGGRSVGYFEIGSVDNANHGARLERFLIDPAARGQGTGQRAMRAIARQFFADARQFHRLELVVAADNTPAITCYRRSGFSVDGLLRESRRFGGEWRSVLVMSLLRAEAAPAPADLAPHA